MNILSLILSLALIVALPSFGDESEKSEERPCQFSLKQLAIGMGVLSVGLVGFSFLRKTRYYQKGSLLGGNPIDQSDHTKIADQKTAADLETALYPMALGFSDWYLKGRVNQLALALYLIDVKSDRLVAAEIQQEQIPTTVVWDLADWLAKPEHAEKVDRMMLVLLKKEVRDNADPYATVSSITDELHRKILKYRPIAKGIWSSDPMVRQWADEITDSP